MDIRRDTEYTGLIDLVNDPWFDGNLDHASRKWEGEMTDRMQDFKTQLIDHISVCKSSFGNGNKKRNIPFAKRIFHGCFWCCFLLDFPSLRFD